MVNLVGSPPNPRDVRLRHVMSGCNRVVSQCEMAGASGWVNNAPTAGTFRVGRREARSLSERWPADPLLARHRCGSRPSTRAKRGSSVAAPLTLVRAADWCGQDLRDCDAAGKRLALPIVFVFGHLAPLLRNFEELFLDKESRVCLASSSHSRALARYSSALLPWSSQPIAPSVRYMTNEGGQKTVPPN